MLESVEWGEYRLGELFKIESVHGINSEKLVEGYEYDYVTRTSINQGVLQKSGYIDNVIINQNNVWSLGLLQMDFFYRQNPWYAGQFVRKISPKIHISNGAVPFFTTILNKQKKKLLSVLVRNVDNVFRESKVQLPVKNGKINFSFIEKFIAELDAQRIAELDAYLRVTGLDDYELTESEQKVLFDYKKFTWKEYKIGDVFEKLNVKKAKKSEVRKSKDSVYNTPVVYCKFGDNGIMYWGKKGDFTTYNNIISIIYNGAIAAGKVYSQKEDTGILAESYFIKFKNREVSHDVNLFFTTVLEKVLYKKYSRDFLATWNGKVENDTILLPVKKGDIDVNSISLLISALKKSVIMGVVKYSDDKINATRKVALSKSNTVAYYDSFKDGLQKAADIKNK